MANNARAAAVPVFQSARGPRGMRDDGAGEQARTSITNNVRCGGGSVVTIDGPTEGRLFSERDLAGEGSARLVLRFGTRVSLSDVPTVPARYRGALGGPDGWLVGARLRSRTGEVWCRLAPRRMFSRTVRTVPLTASQPPAPTPDALELRRGMRVDCQAGPVGRLEGIVVDLFNGLASELVVHVRGDIEADVEGPTDPIGALLRVQGQRVLLPPSWATKAEQVPSGVLFAPASARLPLLATAAQVAHSLVLRDDAALAADVWSILAANPSLQPALGHVTIAVRDGTVTLRGSIPSIRQRLAAEQDVWHVPGVLALRDELLIG
jgi:hypothetical protein